MTVEAPSRVEDGGLSPAEAAALAVIVDRYAQLRASLTASVGPTMLWILRQFLALGPGGKVSTSGQARAVLALKNASAADVARSLTARQLGALYDRDAVGELATELANQFAAAQQQAAALAGEFERMVLQFFNVPTNARVTGPTVSAPETIASRPDTGPSKIVTSRSGVDPVQVYQRPVVTFRYKRSEEASVADALVAAEQRLQRLAEDDLIVAERDAFWDIINGPDVSTVTGYRRVIRPELSRFGSCGLCIVAADRVYSRENLLPIHGGCQCIVLPILDGKDPGLNLNSSDLKALYDAAGGTAGAGLKRVRVQTVEHGELGPVLIRAGSKFLTQEEAEARRRERVDRGAATSQEGGA